MKRVPNNSNLLTRISIAEKPAIVVKFPDHSSPLTTAIAPGISEIPLTHLLRLSILALLLLVGSGCTGVSQMPD